MNPEEYYWRVAEADAHGQEIYMGTVVSDPHPGFACQAAGREGVSITFPARPEAREPEAERDKDGAEYGRNLPTGLTTRS